MLREKAMMLARQMKSERIQDVVQGEARPGGVCDAGGRSRRFREQDAAGVRGGLKR